MTLVEQGLDHLDQGICITDADLTIVAVNRRFVELLDLPADLVRPGVGNAEDVFRYNARRGEYGGGDVEAVVAERLAMIRTPERCSYRRRRADGTVLEFVSTGLPGGGSLSTVTDITRVDRAEEGMRSRGRELDLLAQVTRYANDYVDPRQVLQATLTAICRFTGWPVGHVYDVVPGLDRPLLSSGIWHLDDPVRHAEFREVTELTRFARGEGLPGRVLKVGRPMWTVDIADDPEFPRSSLVKRIDLTSGFAFPVIVGDEIVAVLEFYCDVERQPDDDLLLAMQHIGTALGRAIERHRARDAVEASERRFRSLIEGSIQGVLVHRDLQPLFANRAFADIFGFDRSEDVLAMDDALTLFHEDERPRIVSYAKSRSRGENVPGQYEVRAYRRDGSLVWLDLRVTPVDWDGMPAIQVTFFDITGRKNAEEALRRNEAVLAEAQSVAQVGSWGHDFEGRWYHWSDETARILGIEPDDPRRDYSRYLERVHPDDIAGMETVVAGAMAERGSYQCEYRIVRPDGTMRYVRERGRVRTAADGNLESLIGTIQDITDQVEAERALRASEARLRALLDNTADAIVTMTEDGRIESFNRAAERLFGYDAGEAVGRPVEMLMPESYRVDHQKHVDRYMETGVGHIVGIGPREVVAVDRFGREIPIDLAIGEFRPDERRLFIGSIRDISERKVQQERLEQARKMELVGQLSGGVAHDFNNVLATVLGNLELLDEEIDPTAPNHRLVANALRATRRGAELTQRLLSFARRQVLTPAPVAAGELVEELNELARPTLGRNIAIETEVPGDIGPVLADRGQLESALLNLYFNARDAMPDGGILRVTFEKVGVAAGDGNADLPEGTYVRIRVADSGCGMTEEVAVRAFDPFFTTKEVGAGSGLGLSMVYGFAKQSGGDVTVETEVGRGTVVSLYLPRAVQPAAEAAAADRLQV